MLAQGNPGAEYHITRHNIGWQCLDAMARKHNTVFTNKPKFFAEIAELTLQNEKILLVKPTTFYNNTGKAARALCDFYKLSPLTDVLVLHDDLALAFGKLRIRERGRDAGNNGIKSLNAHIGMEYMRLRIGIYSPLRDRIHDADFVLKRFSNEEQAAIVSKIIPAAIGTMHHFIEGNLAIDSMSVL